MRPSDHTWHTGLYFGWVHANDANLWGGPWYLPATKKYEHVDDSHGQQRHENFTQFTSDDAISVSETLSWLDAHDAPFALEERTYALSPCLRERAGISQRRSAQRQNLWCWAQVARPATVAWNSAWDLLSPMPLTTTAKAGPDTKPS